MRKLLCHLLDINSANPATQAHAPGEAALARYCVDWLRRRQVAASLVEVGLGPRRPMVHACLPSMPPRPGKPRLLLLGHLDTHAWHPRPRDTGGPLLHGAGAYDMKAGIAIMLTVMARLKAQDSRGRLDAFLVPDEEHASRATRKLGALLQADGAIVLEGTGLGIGNHQFGRVQVVVRPPSAQLRERLLDHLSWGSMKSRGLDGVSYAMCAGAAPDFALRCKVAPGQRAGDVAARLLRMLGDAGMPHGEVEIRESFATAETHPLYAALSATLSGRGLPARSVPTDGWTEAGIVAAAGTPVLVFGPGGGGAHTDAEWVDMAQARCASGVLLDTIKAYAAGNV